MNNQELIQRLRNKAEKLAIDTVNETTEYIARQAQNGFDRFMIEVPADDPIVDVFTTSIQKEGDEYSRRIECHGNQVIFIEFGAGVYNYTETELRLYKNLLPNIDPRPANVDEIGHYHNAKWGRSRGQDDLWFYKSETGRESETAHLVKYNKRGDPIMVTRGNRPARALYRAMAMAMRRIKGGKMK